MTLPARRLVSAALIFVGLLLSTTALLARLPMDELSLVATVTGPNLGALQLTPGSGLDTTRTSMTTVSSGVNKGCPAGSAYIQASATGPGGWSGGLLVLGTTDQDLSTTNDFTVPMADTWAGIAASNATSVVAGTYTVKLSCIDVTTTVATGTFTGSLVFTAGKTYSTGSVPTPTPTATPTATATATATVTATATATASASATPTPSTTATPTASSSATPTATATASSSPTPTASETATPTPEPTASETASPLPTSSADLVAYDGSGATLSSTPTLRPGAVVRVVAQGYEPDEEVTATVFSTPQVLGTVNAGATGIVSYSFQVPTNLAAGPHRLELAGQSHTLTLSFLVARASLPEAAPGGALPLTGFGLGPTLAIGFGLIGAGMALTGNGKRRSAPAARHAAP